MRPCFWRPIYPFSFPAFPTLRTAALSRTTSVCQGGSHDRDPNDRPLEGARLGGRIVVLFAGDEPIGFSSVHGIRENENLLVNWIGIRPAWRRRGYASFLLRHILAVAAEEGYATSSLPSEARNGASLALYHGQGWEVEGDEKQFAKYLHRGPTLD